MKAKVTKAHVAIFVANVIYLSVFAFLFSGRKNYEFLIYVGTVGFFVVLISFLHRTFNFPTGLLLGLSAWGLLHMLGGFVIINDGVLYELELVPGVFRFDKFVHAFGFGFATLFSYHILRPSLGNRTNRTAVSVLLILIGMGLGALNEIIEFIAVLTVPQTGVGGYLNTMWDMVFNTIGAALAAAYVNVRYLGE